jgi:hypothetical protein
MTPPPKPIRPLVSPETMEKIVSSRRSISSEEFDRQVETHTGKPTRPAKKPVYKNGRKVWVAS